MASAPGRKSWQTRLNLVDSGATATASVPELEVEFAESKLAAPPSAVPRADEPRSPARPMGLGTQKTLALASAGLGVIGLGVGTAFGLRSKATHGDADSYCNGADCNDARGVELARDAIVYGNFSTAAFIVGTAGLAGGAVL